MRLDFDDFCIIVLTIAASFFFFVHGSFQGIPSNSNVTVITPNQSAVDVVQTLQDNYENLSSQNSQLELNLSNCYNASQGFYTFEEKKADDLRFWKDIFELLAILFFILFVSFLLLFLIKEEEE